MMRFVSATEPGSPNAENEDWHYANEELIVVLDGATARTDTGCIHGVAWYAGRLGNHLVRLGMDHDLQLGQVLSTAIALTADDHRECDLSHPGTPSATVAMLRTSGPVLEYLVLGDTTVIVETITETQVMTDDRVDSTAVAERAEANHYPIGSPEKRTALVQMKEAELAVRNQPGGYWVAAANPAVAEHAMMGEFALNEVRRAAVLTDGAVRAVSMFELLTWHGVLDVLAGDGPTEVIRRVRAEESADPSGAKWPRNKAQDDATAVYVATPVAGRFRRRTELRSRLPRLLVNVGVAGKPDKGCGDHEWYNADGVVERCYHCAIGQRPYDAAHFDGRSSG